MNKMTDLIKAVHATGGEPLFKGDVVGHEFHGNQYQDGGASDKPVSVKEKDAPAFVHSFLKENSTIAKIKAALKSRSTEKLQIALKLIAGHEDSASKLVRDSINDELKSREGK